MQATLFFMPYKFRFVSYFLGKLYQKSVKKSPDHTRTARTFFVRAVSVSIINQLKLYYSFRLCLASVHLPYPLHLVFML